MAVYSRLGIKQKVDHLRLDFRFLFLKFVVFYFMSKGTSCIVPSRVRMVGIQSNIRMVSPNDQNIRNPND